MKRPYITALTSFFAGAACTAFLMHAYGQQTAPATAPADVQSATATSLPPNETGQGGNGPASQNRLKNSPRHAQWVDDIKVPGSDKPLKAWVVYPERPDKAPVVLTVMEIFGMSDWVQATTDQIAADGFIAIAPDFLSIKPAGAAVSSLTPAEVIADLNACRDYAAKNIPAASGKTGIVGFCWGGTQVFNYAVAQPELSVGVAFYGTPPLAGRNPDADQLAKIKAPLAGFFGGSDNRVTSMVQPTKDAMDKLKLTYEPHVFPDTGHGFMRQQSGGNFPAGNAKAAQDAWPAAIKFLKDHLEPLTIKGSDEMIPTTQKQ